MPEVLRTVDGNIATLTLNRAEARNGMTIEMLDELTGALDSLAVDDDVHVVVVTGAGRDFSVGADLSALAGRNPRTSRSEGLADERIWNSYRIPVLLHQMPQITIAGVNGACAGAAFGVACAADLRVADEQAIFRTAFAAVGVAGDMSGAWSLHRIVGSSRAAELFLLNEKIDAAAALAMGLVSRVFPVDDFAVQVDELAHRISRQSPLALRAMKANARDAERLGLAQYSAAESERHMALLATDDVREAAMAFLEGRPPVFRGR
jgi:2-(1,2-epoxy-1,2-dihydrophenyl)acetyl-CoA isomerase